MYSASASSIGSSCTAMGGAELAVGLVLGAEQAAQLGAGRQRDALRHAAQAGLRRELHHRHRRRGCEVVRIDHLQQRLREGRELRLQLELDARGEQREAFEQPLDIGIGDIEAAEVQTRGDLRELAGEFPAGLAHERELGFVMIAAARGSISRVSLRR